MNFTSYRTYAILPSLESEGWLFAGYSVESDPNWRSLFAIPSSVFWKTLEVILDRVISFIIRESLYDHFRACSSIYRLRGQLISMINSRLSYL